MRTRRWALAIGGALLLAAPAWADPAQPLPEETWETQETPPSATAAGTAASAAESAPVDDARSRAEQARREAQAAAERVEAAERALAEAREKAEAAKAREEALAADPAQQAGLAAQRAEEAARVANERALASERQLLLLDARVRELEAGRALDRPGFELAGGILWAPENFDFDVGESDAEGLWWRAGYRATRHVALDVRFDLLNEFDVAGSAAEGGVEPWAATGNVRLFLPFGRFQPYASIGLGAASARIRGTRFRDGSTFSVRETAIVFRGGGGFDLYVSPNVALNFDAAYYSPGDPLDEFSFASVGGGIVFRF